MEMKPFRIESHGSCKDPRVKAYKRTQKSVLQALKEELNTSKPREAIDNLSENAGGIFGFERLSAFPRNVKQANNIKQKLKEGALAFDWQMKNIDKFCINPRHFSVFQVDPTLPPLSTSTCCW